MKSNYMSTVFNAEQAIESIINDIKSYFADSDHDTCAVIGISGGKDSTIAATLLTKALGPQRVFGVLMPQGTQHDINYSEEVVNMLGIEHMTVNIGEAVSALYTAIDATNGGESCRKFGGVVTNTPARLRMASLYAIAAMMHGRVINTCNASEDYVGYSTKYGDNAGDFAVLCNYTVTEVRAIGEALGISDHLIYKIPEDGMSGVSDEAKFGFTYDTLDALILDGVIPDVDTFRRIENMYKMSRHKEKHMPSARNIFMHKWNPVHAGVSARGEMWF